MNSHSKPNHAVLREFWKNIFVYTDFFNFKCDFCRYSYCYEYLLDHIAVCEEIGQRKSFLNAIIVNNLMHLGFEVNSYTAYNPDLFIWSNFIKYFFNNLALKIVFEEVNFTLQNATPGCFTLQNAHWVVRRTRKLDTFNCFVTSGRTGTIGLCRPLAKEESLLLYPGIISP